MGLFYDFFGVFTNFGVFRAKIFQHFSTQEPSDTNGIGRYTNGGQSSNSVVSIWRTE